MGSLYSVLRASHTLPTSDPDSKTSIERQKEWVKKKEKEKEKRVLLASHANSGCSMYVSDARDCSSRSLAKPGRLQGSRRLRIQISFPVNVCVRGTRV